MFFCSCYNSRIYNSIWRTGRFFSFSSEVFRKHNILLSDWPHSQLGSRDMPPHAAHCTSLQRRQRAASHLNYYFGTIYVPTHTTRIVCKSTEEYIESWSWRGYTYYTVYHVRRYIYIYVVGRYIYTPPAAARVNTAVHARRCHWFSPLSLSLSLSPSWSLLHSLARGVQIKRTCQTAEFNLSKSSR